MQGSCVRQEQHHQDGDESADDEVRLAPSHPGPGAVGPFADEGLDYHAHEGRKYPEETELVRVGTERGEYAADVGALQGVGNLYSEETEAQVEHLPESKLFPIGHSMWSLGIK